MIFSPKPAWMAAALAFGVVAGASSASAGEPSIADISGPWKGAGQVQRDEKSNPVRVNCNITGEQDGDLLAFDGKCRAMLVLSRDIGARIVRDGDRFTGTYKGSDAGIADLVGVRAGPNRIELEMTFPRVVNGDDKAVMIFETAHENEFSITTTDMMESGVEVTTSRVVFKR